MAPRTKQTSRKSTGGKASRIDLSLLPIEDASIVDAVGRSSGKAKASISTILILVDPSDVTGCRLERMRCQLCCLRAFFRYIYREGCRTSESPHLFV